MHAPLLYIFFLALLPGFTHGFQTVAPLPPSASSSLSRSQWLSSTREWREDWESIVVLRYLYVYYHGLQTTHGQPGAFALFYERRRVEWNGLRDKTTTLLQTLTTFNSNASVNTPVFSIILNIQSWQTMVHDFHDSLQSDFRSVRDTVPPRLGYESYCVNQCHLAENTDVNLQEFTSAFNESSRVLSRAFILGQIGIAQLELEQESHAREIGSSFSYSVHSPLYKSIVSQLAFIPGFRDAVLLIIGGILAFTTDRLMQRLRLRSPKYALFPTAAARDLYTLVYDFADMWEQKPLHAAAKQATALREDLLPRYPFLHAALARFLDKSHHEYLANIEEQFDYLTSKVTSMHDLMLKQSSPNGIKSHVDRLRDLSLEQIGQNIPRYTEESRIFLRDFDSFWQQLKNAAGETGE